MSDKKRAKKPPPDPHDSTLVRTCNQCNARRDWVEAYCKCGSPEFRLVNRSDCLPD